MQKQIGKGTPSSQKQGTEKWRGNEATQKAWKRWERREVKAGRGWENEQGEEEIHLKSI